MPASLTPKRGLPPKRRRHLPAGLTARDIINAHGARRESARCSAHSAAVGEIGFDSSVDGRRHPGLDRASRPTSTAGKKYPLLLEIHGGPIRELRDELRRGNSSYTRHPAMWCSISNPRGSTGYGEQFADLIHHDYPDRDFDDLMSASRCDSRQRLHRSQSSVRDGRQRRRRPDGLDCGTHGPVSRRGRGQAGDQLGKLRAHGGHDQLLLPLLVRRLSVG